MRTAHAPTRSSPRRPLPIMLRLSLRRTQSISSSETGFVSFFEIRKKLDVAAGIAARVNRLYGAKSIVMDGPTLSKAEPGLRRPVAGAVH